MAIPFIPVPNTVRVNMIYQNQGQNAENVYHVLSENGWTPATMITLAGAFLSWESASGKTMRHPTTSCLKCTVTDLETQNAPGIEQIPSVPIVGTHAGIAVPQSVTLAVKWGTQYRGRSYRGRTYHIGMCLEDTDAGKLKDSSRPVFQTPYQALLDLVMPNSGELVIVSRFTNKLPRITGVCTPIATVSIEGNVDTQRRRLPGRGN